MSTEDGAAVAEETDSLLLSDFVLAGANTRDRRDESSEDGIVTAQEVASLDLSRVDWAVLSGCETGLGTIETGEGVLGLRRAFEAAGAGTVIMGLWKVKDDSTRQWMRELCRARLSGADTIEATRHATLRMLDERRKNGQSTHPSAWGDFVAAGDWR